MKKQNNFKEILGTLKIATVIYFSIYLFGCYLKWELPNPFQWFIDIEKASMSDRFAYLLGFVLLGLVSWVGQVKIMEN